MAYLKNTAGQFVYFVLINVSTGAIVTGASVTAKRSRDGAAQEVATGIVTEQGSGQYEFAMSAADINADEVGLLFTASNSIPVNITITTSVAGTTTIESDTTTITSK